jgi:hypothetical protein
MTKPKAVAQAVTAKKRMPSLLRTANNRIHNSRSLSVPRHHQNVVVPPISSFEADPKTLAQISDLTEPLYDLKRDPPIHEVHSAYHSAASSLTHPSALEKARRSFSSEPDDMNHPKYSNLIYPESPKTSKPKKQSVELDPGLALIGSTTLHALDKFAIQKSESSDTLSQQYVIKKRDLVVGIPVESTDSLLQQKTPSPRTDATIGDNTSRAHMPHTPEVSVPSGKPARKIGFKAVKALINRVHSGSPRRRSSSIKGSKKDGPRSTTELSQRDQALLLASNPNVEETVSGIGVILKASIRRPAAGRTALKYRENDMRLEPPDLTRTRSSNDPSPKTAAFDDDHDDGPPDLTETMSSAEMSMDLRFPDTSTNEKLREPPEFHAVEAPRAGSPELRRGDISPVLAKGSRRRGLEPDAVVVFVERTPVDAPEYTVPQGHLSIVGIPVDSDEVLSRMEAEREEMELDGEVGRPDINSVEENKNTGDNDCSIVQSNGPHAPKPFDSSSDGSVPMAARVARSRRAAKPINPFDSSSSENSSNPKTSPKTDNKDVKINPFEWSTDSDVIDDPFDRLRLENQLDSLSDDGIPTPGVYMNAGSSDVRNRQKRDDGPSPLREHNHGNQPPQPPQPKLPHRAAILPQNLSVGERLQVPDQEKSQLTTPLRRNLGPDSSIDRNTMLQDTVSTKNPSVLMDTEIGEEVALADSISEWSGNVSDDSANGDVKSKMVRPQQVTGQIVSPSDELNFPVNDKRRNEGKFSVERTPKVSNEAKKSELPKWKMLSLESVHQLGTGPKPKSYGEAPSIDVRPEPSESRRSTRVRVSDTPVSSTEDNYDRYHLTDTADEREDVLDRFFSFIRQTIRRSPKTKRSVSRSVHKLKPEAKLIVEAAMEKAKQAESTEGGLDQFYQDEDIELAFRKIDENSVQSIKQLMIDHKRTSFLKIKKLGESIASTTHEVDASEASELLSELEDFSSVVKGAAKRSLRKPQLAGRQGPRWTKELIDLTGVDSFRELDDKEAIWMFDLNSSPRTPRSDLESIMDFAAKRLGLALDPEIVLMAASKTKPPVSDVGALSPKTNVSDSPFAAIRNDNSRSPTFKFDRNLLADKTTKNEIVVDDVLYDTCSYAEAVLCGETGYGTRTYKRTVIENSASDESNQVADKYDVSNRADKYSDALDDKVFEDNLSGDQFNAEDPIFPSSSPKQLDHESDVSSSDGLPVILAKIKRDIQDAEESRRREQTHVAKESPDSHTEIPSFFPDSTKPTNRRDFLDVLFEATGSLLCGAVDVERMYGGTRNKFRRKKEKKRPATTFADDPDDPFSGLELESPTGDDSPAEADPNLDGNIFVNSIRSSNDFPSDGKPSYHLIDITSDPSDRRECHDHKHGVEKETATQEQDVETLFQLDVNAFENTGSLLNKGPFSPIDEQPSAEDDTDFLQQEHSPTSPYKEEVVQADHWNTHSRQNDVDVDACLGDSSDQSGLNVANDRAGADRSFENESEGDDVAYDECLLDDVSNQSDPGERDRPGTETPDTEDFNETGFSETDQFVNIYDLDHPRQSSGPKPENFHLHYGSASLIQIAREPPIPEILERVERASAIHNGGDATASIHDVGEPTVDDSKRLGLNVSEEVHLKPIKIDDTPSATSVQGNVGDSANSEEHPHTDEGILKKVAITSKGHGSPKGDLAAFGIKQTNETPQVGVDRGRALNRSKAPPTPEDINRLYSGNRSAYTEKSIEEANKASVSSAESDRVSNHTKPPPTPESINRLSVGRQILHAENPFENVVYNNEEKSPPPAPEIKRPLASDFSKSKVSIIRSKFENASAWGSADKTKVKPQDARLPEAVPIRISRISSLRSKYEKQGCGNEVDGATVIDLREEPSYESKLDFLQAAIDSDDKTEKFPDLIDLTSTGYCDMSVHQIVEAEHETTEAALPGDSIEAVESGEGLRPEDPIFVDEGRQQVHQSNDYSSEPRTGVQPEHIDLVSHKGSGSVDAAWVGEDGRNSDIAFSLSRSTAERGVQPEHIDLVSHKGSGSVDAAWVSEDGRNSDIAFSLSPSTAASSRVLPTIYTQRHLFDALPVLAASSSSSEPDLQHDMLFRGREIGDPIGVPEYKDYDDGYTGSQSSDGVSISSTNVEGAKHCDLDPNTIPDEIAVNRRLTPPTLLLEKQHLSNRLSWQDDGSNESSSDESASLLLALTRSEVESDVLDVLDAFDNTPTSGTVMSHRKGDKEGTSSQSIDEIHPDLIERRHVRPDAPVDELSRQPSARYPFRTDDRETEENGHNLTEGSYTPVGYISLEDTSRKDMVPLQIRTIAAQREIKEETHSTLIEGRRTRADHAPVDEASREGLIRTPSTVDPDSPTRKVSSPLFSSIRKRLSKSRGEAGTIPEPIDAEELFVALDLDNHGVIDVTSYATLPDKEPDKERPDRDPSTSASSDGVTSSQSSTRPNKQKTNHFLETIMERLRVSPSAQRFTPKSTCTKSSPLGSVKSRSSASQDNVSKKESSNADDIFQRYDEIVKNMVVLDEERLARVQAKQMASIVMAADSAVEHIPNSPQALSEIARRLRRTAAERKKEEKAIAYRNEDRATLVEEDTTLALGSVSAASNSTHPSSHARQLRRDLQAALDKSAAIRSSQLKLGQEMADLQARLHERGSSSPTRIRSLPSSPIKSFYHRNCAVSTDSTGEAEDLSPVHIDDNKIPNTISTKATDMTSEDEDIQNRHLESIRSGLRSSLGSTSPRGKARRRRFRRSE